MNTELQGIDLDAPGVERLDGLHRQAIATLSDNLDDELVSELHRFVPALEADDPSEAEVRLAHVQLVGWLEGLFQGIDDGGRPAAPATHAGSTTWVVICSNRGNTYL